MEWDTHQDNLLWSRVQNDDEQAFRSLYDHYVSIIFAGVIKHTQTRNDAEDLVQDVFLSLWEQRKRIILKGRLFPYLYSIARYKVYKYIKEMRIISAYQLKWEDFCNLPGELSADPEIFKTSEWLRMETELEEEILQLPPQTKKVYEMRTVPGLKIADIARELELSEHTVKKHLANARKRLRMVLLRVLFILAILLTLTRFLPGI